MGFATSWLGEKALFPQLIKETPDDQTGIIIVVPAYNEPGITILLDSLISCAKPGCKVEVIIIVNAQPGANNEAILNNKICIRNIENWKKKNINCFFRLYVIDTGQPSADDWGVGFARKTGMDEALRRFNDIEGPDGVIVCLDADCTVERNYLVAIEEHLLQKKERRACSIYFEHPLQENDLPENLYKYIIIYELHLRYYIQALKFAGFPFAFHTVGSAMAVKASQYMRVGGMNRRQAGEDFYFIQKLAPLKGYFTLNNTTVYPSPRPSLRVPFGTGATISRLLKTPGEHLLTYNFNAFRELRSLFSTALNLFHCSTQESEKYYNDLPDGLRSFISEKDWILKINEINGNTSGYESFLKRFFGWFNMFRIVKYLNHVHIGIYEKQPVPDSAILLLASAGHQINSIDPLDLLLWFRSTEKDLSYSSLKSSCPREE